MGFQQCPSPDQTQKIGGKFETIVGGTGAQLMESLVHGAPNDYECNVSAINGPTRVPPRRRTGRNIAHFCRSWIFLWIRTKNYRSSEKRRTVSRADHWTHMRSKNAREKEIKCLWDMEVYEYSTEAEARARTGRNPVGSKWIDTNKGSAEAPRNRSRLVCTEVRHKGVEPILSATGVACQKDVIQVEDLVLISIADVSRAYFHTDAVRDVYVPSPDEDPKAKQPGVCGKLRKTTYGSLDAAQRWDNMMPRFWRREDFPEAWLLRATSYMQTYLLAVTIFHYTERCELTRGAF